MQRTGDRTGGDVVVETLVALGATTAFGIPGQHALALFDALRRSEVRLVGSRTENNAAFAADGYARAAGMPAVLLLSTGPGALTALAGLQEARATAVPVVVVASQVPRAGLGGRRTGHLHQLDDQGAAAAQVSKSVRRVLQQAELASALAAAWEEALTAPMGPVWVEVPQDVLLETAQVPPPRDPPSRPVAGRAVPPRADVLAEAARLLDAAERPVVLAGGGVRRSGAEAELAEVAEALRAPVVCTPGGKGAFAWDHPLSVQSWVEDNLVTDLLAGADVLLAVGTSMGEVTSNYYTLRPRGRVVQVDAEPRVLGSNGPVLGVHADARLALTGVAALLARRPVDGRAEAAVRRVLDGVRERLDRQHLDVEQQLLAAVRGAVPDGASTFWDMTIAAYWAWSAWDARGGQFHSAQGAGGIGWAYGAALGGAVATGERVLAVSGDGGAMYSLGELAVAQQHQLPVTWLVVDDGGYGILREYMTDAFGAATATELAGPDFAALAASFGVPAVTTDVDRLADALARAWEGDGPNVVVVRQHLRMPAPTHLG